MARVLTVAFQASSAVVIDFFIGRRHSMRIVAGSATQLAVTLQKATTFVHLLHLTHDWIVGALLFALYEDGPKQMKRQARPKVKNGAPSAKDPNLAL
jgi:hypothetical protein